MHIHKIEIENVRGFEMVELDLDRDPGRFRHAGWTVVAGRNGTGKTSLLKAIALALAGPARARSLQESFAGWIRSESSKAEMRVWLRGGPGDEPRSNNFWVGLKLTRQASQSEPTLTVADVLKDWPDNLSKAENGPWKGHPSDAENGPWNDNPVGWFLAAYGPFRRLSGHAQDALRLMAGPPRFSRVVSLFREDASLVMTIEWLRNIYLRRLENKPGATQLEANVLKLLNHGRLLDDTQIERIDSEALWTRRNGTVLPLQDLGEGYRAVTTLVLDIVKQLHDCYGRLDIAIDGTDGVPKVQHEGVVLIDEVDAHLHIEWQKRIGFWLKEHFPNIQFIVTTHSPFICQAADPKGLIRLPAPGSGERAGHVSDEDFKIIVNGGADDAAFTALFGIEHTHSDPAEERKVRVAQIEAKIIRGESTPEERAELERLLAELPDTGAAIVERVARKHEALR